MARTGATDSGRGDLDFTQRHAVGVPASRLVTVSREQLRLAGKDPARGWPAYSAMYPIGNPAQVPHEPIFISKSYRNLEGNHGWATGDPMEPLSTAPSNAGAELVDAGDFRTLGGNAGPLRPLAGRDFKVWASPDRNARDGKECHEWRLGVRLGPYASGALSQCIFDLDATPPGIRKAGFREVMEVLRSSERVGYPRSVATGTQLGFSFMAYQ